MSTKVLGSAAHSAAPKMSLRCMPLSFTSLASKVLEGFLLHPQDPPSGQPSHAVPGSFRLPSIASGLYVRDQRRHLLSPNYSRMIIV